MGIDGMPLGLTDTGMPHPHALLDSSRPLVVGSVGTLDVLRSLKPADAMKACDLIELRLDLLGADISPSAWQHLEGIPRLITARSHQEGGAPGISDPVRLGLLDMAMPDAAWVDLEVASIPNAEELIETMNANAKPWIASFHDFSKTPPTEVLIEKAGISKASGAAVFKVAAMITCPSDLSRLAEFQLEDHGIPVATMGMGRLGVVSRLLCAQCGSVFNYGYLGAEATAPGQWSAAEMKTAVARLP